jgi:hypothetical protein
MRAVNILLPFITVTTTGHESFLNGYCFFNSVFNPMNVVTNL